jgi:hypothetical protein
MKISNDQSTARHDRLVANIIKALKLTAAIVTYPLLLSTSAALEFIFQHFNIRSQMLKDLTAWLDDLVKFRFLFFAENSPITAGNFAINPQSQTRNFPEELDIFPLINPSLESPQNPAQSTDQPKEFGDALVDSDDVPPSTDQSREFEDIFTNSGISQPANQPMDEESEDFFANLPDPLATDQPAEGFEDFSPSSDDLSQSVDQSNEFEDTPINSDISQPANQPMDEEFEDFFANLPDLLATDQPAGGFEDFSPNSDDLSQLTDQSEESENTPTNLDISQPANQPTDKESEVTDLLDRPATDRPVGGFENFSSDSDDASPSTDRPEEFEDAFEGFGVSPAADQPREECGDVSDGLNGVITFGQTEATDENSPWNFDISSATGQFAENFEDPLLAPDVLSKSTDQSGEPEDPSPDADIPPDAKEFTEIRRILL